MEKYGCNRKEDMEARIKELEPILTKTASENTELKDLKESIHELDD